MHTRDVAWMVCGVGLSMVLAGCGDLSDANIVRVDVLVSGTVIQSLEVAGSGSNNLAEEVVPDATFLLAYDEPVDITSAREHIYLADEVGGKLDGTVAQRLNDITLTPADLMTSGQNHSIVVEEGIDDASENTTGDSYNIVFYVN